MTSSAVACLALARERLAVAAGEAGFVPAVDCEGEAQFGYSAGIRQGSSGELFDPAHPVPDRVGMAEQDAGRLAGGAAIVEPGAEGSEQDRPLAGRDLAKRGQDAAGDVPHYLRVAARRDGEQVAVEDRDALSGERAAQRDSGQPEIPGGVPEIVVARADPDQARAERVQGIRQADKGSPRSWQPRDPDFGIVQEPPRRDHPDAPERRLRLREGMPSGAWYLRGDNDVTAPQRDPQDVRRLPEIGLIQPAFQQRLDHGRAFLLLAEDLEGDLLPVAVGHLLGEGVQGEPHLGGGAERDTGRYRTAGGGVGEAVP